MPVTPERRHEFERPLRRERTKRVLQAGPPVLIGAGLLSGPLWLPPHGGPPWIGLILAAGGAFSKPAMLLVRYLDRRREATGWSEKIVLRSRARPALPAS